MNFIPEKKLGFGLMRLPHTDPTDTGSIDIPQAKAMVDMFLDRGFTYFDTAYMYCSGKSEGALKEILTSRVDRSAYTLTTKLHNDYVHEEADRDKVFYDQMNRTGVDYFDYYLLHGIEDTSITLYEKFDCFNWLWEKKKAGLVRHAGFSFHGSPELLDDLLTRYPDTELVQLQINYLDWNSPFIRARECYEVCVKHNKPVVVMEPVKGGTLAALPPSADKLLSGLDRFASFASWGVRFAASLPNVMLVLSGMSSLEQMDDNTSYMSDFRPITEMERKTLFEAADILRAVNAIACTGCSYCTAGCPMNIPIPRYFSLYNGDMREAENKGWTINETYYQQLSASSGKASDCVKCGQCESMCPQHLSIRDYLEKVAEHFEH